MKRLEFDYDYDLVEKIETILEEINDECLRISVHGKYDVIREILEDLISDGFSIANEIQLEDYDVSYYDKEFVLYVKLDGVNVEKAFGDNEYIYGGGDISFVHEDCSSTLLKHIDSDMIYEFGYVDENEESECDDCDGKCCCDCKEEIKPTTSTNQDFYVNGKSVTKEEFEKKYTEFENKYMDNIKDMLLKYAEWMDYCNDLLKMFY